MFTFKTTIAFLFALLFCECVFAQWTNGQNAEMVAGQANFTSRSPGTSATTLEEPTGIAVDVTNSKVYIADAVNHRVLRYSLNDWGTNQPTAERVFGQANMVSGSDNRNGFCAQNTLSYPYGIFVDSSGRLWVCDMGNNRIVWYNNAHSVITNGPNADGVLGQTNYTNNTPGTTAHNISSPIHCCVSSSGSLYITDQFNNRVLCWNNASSLSPGTNDADLVLGQVNFTSSSSGTTSSKLFMPESICLSPDGSSLFVSDMVNNRVIRFDSPSTASNGQAANGVLGQTNFTSSSSGTTQSKFSGPMGIAMDGGGRLYVSDVSNNRITIFNSAATKADGANADNVLGQANFTSSSSATSQSGLDSPRHNTVKGDKLYVVDNWNNRALRYAPTSPLPVELLSFERNKKNENIVLNWSTASEINSEWFVLMRSADGKQFYEIGKIAAAGNSAAILNYEFTDEAPLNGTNYYKLIEKDIDGNTQESELVTVYFAEVPYLQLKLIPNISSDKTSLYFDSPDGGIYSVKVFNQWGDLVYTSVVEAKKGENKVDLFFSSFSSGPYAIQLSHPAFNSHSCLFIKNE